MNEQENEDIKKKDDTIKILLIGDSGVGKTCICQRYINGTFDVQDGCTIGASYFQKILNINGIDYKLDIWDTAGQEKYRAMGKMFYKNAYIVLFVYDITIKSSFDNLKNFWYKEVINTGEKNIVLAVVGNKIDMFLKENVDEDEGKKWAEEIGAIFALVSAKTGDCIFPLFENVLKKYLKPDFTSKIIIENKRKSDITKIRNSAENRKINKKNKCKC